MIRSFSRAAGASAVIALAIPAYGAFDMSIGFDLTIGHFDNAAPHYNLFPVVQLSGFTDDFDPGNAWLVQSPSGAYKSTELNSSSFNLPTAQDMLDEANAGAWTMEITDGVTGDIRFFEFYVSIDSALAEPDYLRALTVTSHSAGDLISNSPTFEWVVDPNVSNNPDAEYTSLFANIAPGGFQSLPVGTTMWSPPSSPLANGIHSLYVGTTNDDAPQLFVSVDDPFATDGLDELDSFYQYGYTLGAWHSVGGLIVPAPGTAVVAGIAGLIGIRRRR